MTSQSAPDPSQPPSMVLAIFDPERSPHRDLVELFRTLLPPEMGHRSRLDQEVVWVALKLDGAPPEVAATRIAAWLDGLEGAITQRPRLGVVVAAGWEGTIEGAFGQALQDARRFEGDVHAGEVRLTPTLAQVLPEEETRLAPAPDTPCRRWLPARSALRWISLLTSQGELKALACGRYERLHGIDVKISVTRGGAVLAPSEPAYQGDLLRLGIQPRADLSWALTRPSWPTTPDAELYEVGVAPADQPTCAEIAVDTTSGLHAPMLILSEDPLHEAPVQEVLGRASRREGAGARVVELGHLLRDQLGLAGFMVVALPPVLFGGVAPLPLSAAVQHARQKVAEGQLTEALQRLDEQIESGAPGTYDTVFARYLRGGVCRLLRHEARTVEQVMVRAREEALAAGLPDLAARSARELGRLLVDNCDGRGPDADRALALLERALAEHRALDLPLEMGRGHLQLAWLFQRRDNFDRAREHYSLSARLARQGRDLTLQLNALTGLGLSLHDLGQAPVAQSTLEEALRLAQRVQDVTAEIRIHGELGLLHLGQGRAHEAIPVFTTQLQLADRSERRHYQGVARLNLGRAYLAQGALELAERLLGECLPLLPATDSVNRTLAQIALGELALELEEPGRALTLLDEESTPTSEQASELNWRWRLVRARALLGLGREEEASGLLDQAAEQLEDFRATLRRSLRGHALESAAQVHTLRVALASQGVEIWGDREDELTTPKLALICALEDARARALSDALASQVGGGVADVSPRLGEAALEQVIRQLPEGLVLLLTWCLDREVVVVQLRRGQARALGLPLRRVDLAVTLDQLRRAIEEGDLGRTEQLLGALSQALLAPLWRRWGPPQPGEQLGLVTHGPLYHVPWQALPVQGPEGEVPLGVALPVFRTPSLAASCHWITHRGQVHGPPLILADPEQNLPAARREATSVQGYLTDARLRLGAEATYQALREEGREAQLLHLACHAAPQHPEGHVVLRLAPSGRGSGRSKGVYPARPGAAEIAELPLQASVVLLVTCLSGHGEPGPLGEGLGLLPVAFLSAGARSAISSSWSVDDELAAELADHFYPHLRRGEAVAAALHHAQRELWRQSRGGQGWLQGAGAFWVLGDHQARLGGGEIRG